MTQLSFFEDGTKEVVAWTGARGPAYDRLMSFLPRAGRAYASSRNYDFGPENRTNISCLSPWIRYRLLLEEDVIRETFSHHSLSSAEKFIQEVFWRAYFKGWLEQRPDVWWHYYRDVHHYCEELDKSADFRLRYENAITGKTGIDCFDAWALELVTIGYLHNHARMWFASIWIFTLRLPWQLGADFFYRHLIDADPASNTLSWRWVAGLHTKGKNYIARRSNIEKYTQDRFSPNGLVNNAAPLFEEREYPYRPLIEPTYFTGDDPFGLLITQEDCHPETLPLSGWPRGICGMRVVKAPSPFETGSLAESFVEQALSDAMSRAEVHFECLARQIKTDDWGSYLVEWARDLGVKTIVTAQAPMGPVRERIDEARLLLGQADIALVDVTRPYDRACWPHATGGFFKLKKKIPKLVTELGLN